MKSRFILCATMLAAASVSRAAYMPVAIQSSSYNADVIVEANAGPRLDLVTSASVDNGTNNTANTWFEIGFDTNNPANGLPAAGSTFTALDDANHSFTMAPSYTAPNGIAIDTLVTSGTFTLTTPAAYTKLSFLGSGGNGGDGISVVVHHQDGTSETGSFGCPDWFGGTGVAFIANGRCNSTINLTPETDGNSGDGRGNPRIYYRDITLTNTTSPVTSIDLNYASGPANSHNDIMGVSGALTSGNGTTFSPIIVTGYDYDFIVEAGAAKRGRVVSQTIVDGTNAPATTQSLDNEANTGNSWYEKGFNHNNSASGSFNNPSQDLTGTGLPHPGSFITNSTGDHIYQMPADYTVNNSIYIGTPVSITNATITLTTPTTFSGLSFLGSAGNGPVKVNVVINHQGGTSETNTLTVNDWFNTGAPVAYAANGRVAVDTAQYNNVSTGTGSGNSGVPVLLQNDIVLADQVNPVTSIYIENTNSSGGRFAILALSGAQGALPPIITQNPSGVNQYLGVGVSFTAAASANAALTYQWQKQTNGVFGNLVDGGNISGATTTTLTINPIGLTDQAQYRMVAIDSAGFVNSAAAQLNVFSTNLDVTQPGDPISGVNISPFGDGPVPTAIDNSMSTKFGANFTAGKIPGLVISPTAGLTAVNGLRIYTGSDASGRDPSSFKLEGSIDGGHTYALIASNSITLSDSRNTSASVAPDPLTMVCTEVDFNNTNGYTTYRITFPTVKTQNGTQVQFQELELLGAAVPGTYFYYQPTDAKSFDQGSAYFAAYANNVNSQSWYKINNGTYVPLTDGGHFTGSQTASLSISPATFADAADYVSVAYDGSQYITSSVAHLYIYSTNLDITQPGDTTTGFGDESNGRFSANGPAFGFDNTFTEYENGGSGLNAAAGFAPFSGPVGVIITPAAGSTILAGVRFYPGADAPDNDPNSYVLEGSNDGTTYTTIASGPLNLPAARNTIDLVVDPTQASAQEILFSNTKGYTSYRLTFPNIVNSNTASYFEIGDIELLGVAGVGVTQPTIGTTTLSAGNLNIAGSGGTPNGTFSVVTNGDLTVPVANWTPATTGTFDASGNFSISLPVSTSNAQLFYLIKTP